VKKEKLVTSKDEKDWNNFINNTDSVYDKDSEESINYIKKNRTKKIDLHGLSIRKANEEVKFFLIKSYEAGYKKVIIITGKGSRSKVYSDPYKSDKMNILRYSVQNFIENEIDLMKIVKKISQADIKDGGEGAIYLFLKDKNKIKE
jgi:DNA-nicking Smr family endonuclease